MTLLMAALVLSAGGCFNQMSSPEGTVKGFYRAYNQKNVKKMLNYCDPRERTEADRKAAYTFLDNTNPNTTIEVITTTTVSDKESLVWEGDKWVEYENATVEARLKRSWCSESVETIRLILRDQKWYIAHFKTAIILEDESEAQYRRGRTIR